MKQGFYSLFRRITLISMVILLCLPCPLKREVKQAFNVPMTENSQESKHPLACVPVLSESAASESVTLTDQHTCFLPRAIFFDEVLDAIIAFQQQAALPDLIITSPLPFFILHEQYRL